MKSSVNRRQFICGTALAVAASASGGASRAPSADETASASAAAPGTPLITSAPVLQNAAETSVGVSFSVSGDASGWVEYSTDPGLKNSAKVFSGGHGIMTVDDKIAHVRLTGLKPATRYYYRIGADRILYEHGYSMKNLGPEVDPKIHSFTTIGAAVDGTFCVINDTHDHKPAIDLALSKIEKIKPSAVVWNGDASNVTEKIDLAIGIFIHTHEKHPEYAADTPYMFINGNHDFRGRFNRELEKVMMFREASERGAEFAELGRNFVQRLGDIALIGLDTGEDKLDTNPRFAGIFQMRRYRELQARWLAGAVESEAVKTAKFKVAFCHIPLFDPRPESNPGDVVPADTGPRYRESFAIWQRTCAGLWQPSFEKAGLQLVIAAHQHRFRYDPPAPGRGWAQIVGGGPELGVRMRRTADGVIEKIPVPEKFPTVIEGRVVDGKLKVTVHDVLNGRTAGEYVFNPSV